MPAISSPCLNSFDSFLKNKNTIGTWICLQWNILKVKTRPTRHINQSLCIWTNYSSFFNACRFTIYGWLNYFRICLNWRQRQHNLWFYHTKDASNIVSKLTYEIISVLQVERNNSGFHKMAQVYFGEQISLHINFSDNLCFITCRSMCYYTNETVVQFDTTARVNSQRYCITFNSVLINI